MKEETKDLIPDLFKKKAKWKIVEFVIVIYFIYLMYCLFKGIDASQTITGLFALVIGVLYTREF